MVCRHNLIFASFWRILEHTGYVSEDMNENCLILRGQDWSSLCFKYLNTPSQAVPSHQEMIYKFTNPSARIGVVVM